MKVEGVLPALERFDLERSEDHSVDPVLPENLGVVHAFRGLGQGIKQGHPKFAARHDQWWAVCGWPVKVLLPVHFDMDEADACEKCVRVLLTEREGCGPV